jgi:enoyl-CoA hydratase/carnithine racemase
MTKDVDVKIEKGILILTINRVGKKNALTGDMYGVFADAF